MRRLIKWEVAFVAFLAGFLMACGSKPVAQSAPAVEQPLFSAIQTIPLIGDQKAIRLTRRKSTDDSKPQILSVELLPGRGMNVFQIKAHVPGLGVVNLLESPTLEAARELMNGGANDLNGNESFKVGGAILVPFANRIRGRANHGFIMASGMTSVRTEADNSHAAAFAVLQAGDFSERWPSKTELSVSATLTDESFGLRVTANNTGDEEMPVGIGWHPYFVIPSGNRAQARIVIPARQRLLVDNYDNALPTGKMEKVAGTAYDVTVSSGLRLGNSYLDDVFVDLRKDDQGRLEMQVIDQAARYGLRLMGLSKEINAVQIYSPADKALVAIEPQFNFPDPFNPIWKEQNTGMVMLKPGQSVTYGVELMLFVP